MKKILALMLVLLCVFFAACGKDPGTATPDTATPDTVTEPVVTEPATEPTQPPTTLANSRFDPVEAADLIGIWQTVVTLDGEQFNLVDMEAAVEMTLAYRLNADGTYVRGVDPEEYAVAMAQYSANVEAFLLDRLYAKFTAEKLIEKVNKKKIPELWEQEGKADAEVQAKRFVEGLHLDYRFSQLNSSGDYFLQDGKLMLSTQDGNYEPFEYTLTEEGLSVTPLRNTEVYSQLKLELPLLLTKA